jgi:hypothetical protein
MFEMVEADGREKSEMRRSIYINSEYLATAEFNGYIYLVYLRAEFLCTNWNC